ncbi:uncharacterized protein LOC135392359 [Ornithodoros turicata]|uniref:uncharacterized protein LOC135392359 n=1 Tax=Ornithodoros turicata TaxID=34597 RepID=UPI00313A2511
MPTHCCVPLGKQRGTKDENGKKVSFHRFPRQEELYKKWVIAIKRDEGRHFKITKSTVVCSRHFRECDFLPNIASGLHILRDAAVPSLFAFRKTVQARKPPKVRKSASGRAVHSKSDEGSQQLESSIPVSDNASGATSVMEPISEDLRLSESDVPTKCTNAHCNLLYEEQESTIKCMKNKIEMLRSELHEVKQKMYKAEAEKELMVNELRKEKEKKTPFCIERFKDSYNDFHSYTGMVDYSYFCALLDRLDPGPDGCNVRRGQPDTEVRCNGGGRKRALSVENELFLVLCRLRVGLLEFDLAHRFGISQATVSRIFTSWINFAYLKLGALPLWSSRRVVDTTMPPAFVEKYPSTRVILDATEIRCEVPSSLGLQSSTYSNYKSANTFKGLIGISPSGLVSFVSELFTGSASDKECVVKSGFLRLPFEQGDSVMADKGFLIGDDLQRLGVQLNIPPFLRNREQSLEELNERKEIASLRIHVERRIQRVKSFHIFDTSVSAKLCGVINQMWTVAVILTNFQGPIIVKSLTGEGQTSQ